MLKNSENDIIFTAALVHDIGKIAQDEESCVVFGMPKEAIKIGAVDVVLNISRIPEKILQMA